MNSSFRLSATMTILLLLVGSSANLVMAATDDSSFTTTQSTNCETATAATYNALDQTMAVNNAISSQEYVQGIIGYQEVTFNSIFQIDKTIAPYPTCTEQVLSFNVVFTLYNATSRLTSNLVITENSNLTVIGSSLQVNPGTATNYSTNWSGYVAYANSGGTQEITKSTVEWTQPTASVPSTGCGSGSHCEISNWASLMNGSTGPNYGFEQAGTTVECEDSSGSCTNTYFAWYDSPPAMFVECSSGSGGGGAVTISGGDTINATVFNDAYFGGNDKLYIFYVTDENSDTSCYVATTQYMTDPTYAGFILENANVVQDYASDPLAEFGTSSFSTASITTGAVSSSRTINNFYTSALEMQNSELVGSGCSATYVDDNVLYGSLSSGGSFTETWNSSQFTPVYVTGC